MTNRPIAAVILLTVCSLSLSTDAQQSPSKCSPPETDTSYIDEHGTAYVTRVVPVPDTLSPEAQKAVSVARPDTESPRISPSVALRPTPGR